MTSTLTNEICGNGAGSNKQSSLIGQGCVNNGTSIQITALIQSNPNGGENVFGSNGLATTSTSSSDFMVQASTSSQDCSLMNSIPLMNNMLSCMHAHQGPLHQHHLMASPYGQGHHGHHHHHHHHGNSFSSNKTASCSNLLKVDESSDKTPKVGPNHQAEIPPLLTDVTTRFHSHSASAASKSSCSSERGLLNDVGEGGSGNLPIWQPETAHSLSELEFNQYLVVASSCAVGGGSHNEEVALELLQKHGGNVQYALQDLLSTYEYIEEDAMSLFSSPEEASDSEDELTSSCPMGMSSSSKSVAGNGIKQPWQPYEVDLFYEGLVRYHKNFTKIATHVGTKNVKDCVEFYYLWKNICHEESQSFKSLFAQNESVIGQSNAIIEERGSVPLSEDVTSTSISLSTSLTSVPPSTTLSNSSLTKTSPNNASLSSNEVMQSGPSSVSSVV